jgi:hypothetical protein
VARVAFVSGSETSCYAWNLVPHIVAPVGLANLILSLTGTAHR